MEGWAMADQQISSHRIIQQQLKELDGIFQETMETLNTVAGAERVAKWKARTSTLITESLGQKEGQRFAALQPGPVFQNVVNCSAFDQPFVVECDRAVYPVGHFPRRFAYEHESTPLNLQHVFKPGLHPAAD